METAGCRWRRASNDSHCARSQASKRQRGAEPRAGGLVGVSLRFWTALGHDCHVRTNAPCPHFGLLLLPLPIPLERRRLTEVAVFGRTTKISALARPLSPLNPLPYPLWPFRLSGHWPNMSRVAAVSARGETRGPSFRYSQMREGGLALGRALSPHLIPLLFFPPSS